MNDFQQTFETDGLAALYEAMSWARSGSIVLGLPFEFEPQTPWMDVDAVLAQSGVAIEWLVPPGSPAGTPAAPLLSGSVDGATLKAKARVVVLDGGQATPVMQNGLPAPLEINLIPQGLASADVTIPPPQPATTQLSQTEKRRGFIGSLYVPSSFEESETYFVASSESLEATAQRGPREQQLRVIVNAGIPGIPLDSQLTEIKDAPQIVVTAAPLSANDDSAQSKDVHLQLGERAVVQVNLCAVTFPFATPTCNSRSWAGALSTSTKSIPANWVLPPSSSLRHWSRRELPTSVLS